MNRVFSLLLCVIIAVTVARAGLIEPLLREQLTALDSDERIEVMVILAEQLDGEGIIRYIKDKPTRRSHTVAELKALAGRTQAGLLAELETQRRAGRVGRVIPFWLVNAVYCEITPDLVFAIAERPEVRAVQWDKIPTPNALNVEPVFAEPDATGSRRAVTWNVSQVKADSVWSTYGLTGRGVVIGNIDTGVDYTHHDLRNRMWTDLNYPNHGWNFANNNDDPMDRSGHGTHTAGIHSGDGSRGDTTGMAPGSSVMAVRPRTNLVPPFPDTIAENTVFSSMQFCVEPPLSPDNHADVLTMSLGWRIVDWEPRQALWRAAVTNVAAAGLPFFISAGNSRGSQPVPYAVSCPGNSPSPWHNPVDQPGGLGGSITVGAVDSTDGLAWFSSPGPSTWDTIVPYLDYPYLPGLTKPDIAAPGVNVISTQRGGGYIRMSGTSMSAPCAAGIAALMLEKNPMLLPEEVNEIMEISAVPLGSGPKNNDYGSGRVCAMRAIDNTPTMGHDISSEAVLAPVAQIDARRPLAPKLVLRNRGIFAEPNVPVHCRVDSLGTSVYFETITMAVDSGRSDTAVFPDWQVGPGRNSYRVTFWHSLANDTNRRNDTISAVTTTRLHDVKTVSTNLSGRARAETPVNPLVTLKSADYTERDFGLWLRIDSAGTTVYFDSLRVDSVPEQGTRSFTFPRRFQVGAKGQRYEVRAWHDCPTDKIPGNDTLTTSFEAMALIRVLWLHADFGPPDSTLGVKLRAIGDSIDYLDVRITTPTLDMFGPYHSVGVHSNFSFDNPTELGDVLADYIDAGGGVVIGNRGFTSERGLTGRIMTGDYATIDQGPETERATSLGWHQSGHELMQDVGAVGEAIAAGGRFNPAAESIARWQDGRPYVAVSRNRQVVGVNSYPGVFPNPDRTGDWALVFINALHYVAGTVTGVEEFDPFRPLFRVELTAEPSVARGVVALSYLVPSGQEHHLGIYDINGRLVRTLARGKSGDGLQRLSWDTADSEGRRIASGIYFCRLTAGDRTETRKLVIE